MVNKQEEIVLALIEDQRLELKQLRKEQFAVEEALKEYEELVKRREALKLEYYASEDRLRALQVKHYIHWGKGK